MYPHVREIITINIVLGRAIVAKVFFAFIVVDLTPVMFFGASRHIACRVKAELNTLAFLFVRLKYPLGHSPGKFICTRSRDTDLRGVVDIKYMRLTTCIGITSQYIPYSLFGFLAFRILSHNYNFQTILIMKMNSNAAKKYLRDYASFVCLRLNRVGTREREENTHYNIIQFCDNILNFDIMRNFKPLKIDL
ncbi:hypothetical protein QTP88_005112 [Uroleucon formosanum]